jgi:hypothetical protein
VAVTGGVKITLEAICEGRQLTSRRVNMIIQAAADVLGMDGLYGN